MALKLNGYFAYIIEEQGSGVIKFGITKDVVKRYLGSTSYNPRDWILRCCYFFPKASKKDLEEYIDEDFKSNSVIQSHRVRQHKKTEMLVELPYEILEFELLCLWLEWNLKIEGTPHALITKDSPALQGAFVKKAFTRMRKEPKKISFESESIKSFKNTVLKSKNIIKKLDVSINFNEKRVTKPFQMTQICKKLDIEMKMSNYKTISKYLKIRNIRSRRTNGKKVYDIEFL
jgi:hypothetical protein